MQRLDQDSFLESIIVAILVIINILIRVAA